jgi:isopenicillin N synthase-like dioxygenase
MPSAIHEPSMLVPTIDITPFLSDPWSPAADEVISAVRSACVTTGFFQIVGHGISRELQKSTFDAAAAFFALPPKEKMKLDIKKSIGHRGYDMMGTQSYEVDSLPDLKEVTTVNHIQLDSWTNNPTRATLSVTTCRLRIPV